MPLSKLEEEKMGRALKGYVYSSPPITLAEAAFLNDFWTWCAEHYPLWLAPNLITFIGFAFMLAGTVFLFVASPRLDGSLGPRGLCFVAFCHWMYQTMDGSDGKQARRTRSGGPLGHVIDHGVDALTSTIVCLFGAEIMGYSFEFSGMLILLLAQIGFFTSNLTLIHTGTQKFGKVEAQELHVCLQSTCLLKAVFPNFIKFVIPFPSAVLNLLPLHFEGTSANGIEVRAFLAWLSILFTALCGIRCTMYVCLRYMDKNYKSPPGKEALLIAMGQTFHTFLFQMLGQGLFTSMTLLSWALSYRQGNYYALWMWVTVSLVGFGDLMLHMLITYVAYVPLPSLQKSRALRGTALLLLVNVADYFGIIRGDVTLTLQLVVTVLNVASYLQYSSMMVQTMARLLGIKIFRIPYSKP
jgi:phosphatidylglycerophosphate synthase